MSLSKRKLYLKEWREKNFEYIKNWNAVHPHRNNNNSNRRPEQWRAQQKAEKIPLADFCELCPDNEKREATQRHHPDYTFPEIFVSCCTSCHSYVDIRRKRGDN